MNDHFDGGDGSELAVLQSNTSVAIQMAQAELTQAVTTARAFPRSIKLAVDRIMSLATLDAETAAECIYAVPRDGKAIKGPSIRFAEIVASQYGNCHVGSRIVAVDRAEKIVIAEGVFWDLETGSKITKQIQRRISSKTGKIYSDDMIITTGNAAAAIALREAILKGVPKAIWRKAYDRADQVTLGKTETIVQRRENAIKAFAAWGIVPEQIFASLEVGGLDDVGLEEISILTAMFRSIKGGEQTVEAYFPPKVDAMAARQAARGTAKAVEAKAEPAQQQEQAKPAAVEHDQTQTITATGAGTQLRNVEETRVTADGEVVDVKPEPERKAESKPVQTDQPKTEAKQTAPAADLHREPTQLERTADMIIKDLQDGAGPDEIDDLYGEALDRIKMELPAQSRIITDLMSKSPR